MVFFSYFVIWKWCPFCKKEKEKLDKFILEKHNFPKVSFTICPKTTLHFCKKNSLPFNVHVGTIRGKTLAMTV